MSYSVSAAQLWSRKLAMQAEDMQLSQKNTNSRILNVLGDMKALQETTNQNIDQNFNSVTQNHNQVSSYMFQTLNNFQTFLQKIMEEQQKNSLHMETMEKDIVDLKAQLGTIQREQENGFKTLEKHMKESMTMMKQVTTKEQKRKTTTQLKPVHTNQTSAAKRNATSMRKRVLALDFLAEDDY
ncbi:meiotic recombination protein Rec15 [Schizosaccharomyces cryophilus OY26]|uniref:Meiotic recombination protein Rec15 n=1 Tax=Schizosaccharomyces cryophilus (strain OY26 / ATCC MYA-4695 / CBS 11777 / NBRC 106824 / NRRL Y48691) TaxID=653667 RepID=S9VTX7_SCHCR|nr:meiotic recombination protein Rec15 [Schizosaccharomyces cryophilus OY26]EPY49540.1 meiotic recombination protein Rec15 [Schizosaccharomyces cryophilus OY26]